VLLLEYNSTEIPLNDTAPQRNAREKVKAYRNAKLS
jgi:hypothetical protein